MYRRPLMSVLQKSFHLVDMDVFDASLPKMIRLPRAVATELVLLSVLAPLAVADVAADFCQDISAPMRRLRREQSLPAHWTEV